MNAKLLALSLIALAACTSLHSRQFGAAVSDASPVAATTVLHHPEMYDGKTVVIEGTITEVCPKKGCWMMLRDGDREMRVTFKDYGFFVPLDCAGTKARIEGAFSITETSVEDARHYLEDAKKFDEAAKITAPVKTLSLVATGVELFDAAPAASGSSSY